MKQHITKEQLLELSPEAQQRLSDWFKDAYRFDDEIVRVYIPQEEAGEYSGFFGGEWDREYVFEFNYPKTHKGKLKNHRGTILPLLDIGQMMEIIGDNDTQMTVAIGAGTCDYLWHVVKALIERGEL